ncbi:MAG TPA: phosphatidylglycerophosphatase A, partial [Syntrophales bacterium]|nr:phosphatidylglycerophosphatase A [Syntrophales bacterium]
PFASGTAGTIAAIPLYLALSSLSGPLYLLTAVAFTFLAIYAAREAEVIFGQQDSPRIVVDEWVGFLWTMLFIPPTLPHVVGGLVLFRFFDIVKLFPANVFQDRLPGGYGVVMDDVAAGVYANIGLHLLIRGGII